MSLRVAVQMDPIEAISIAGDSTFVLMETAQARGHVLWVHGPGDLRYEEGRVIARARHVTVQRVEGDHARCGAPRDLDLATDIDVVLMRQDPPFDMAYLTAAHLLAMVHPATLVVNDPAQVAASPEKISPLMFPDLMPPTLVARDRAAIADFRARHGAVVIKPLYGNAGSDVFLVREGDGNLDALLGLFFARSPEPVMVQAFVPAVTEGDKRIILVDGAVAGGFNRRPRAGDIRSNLAAGGSAEAVELSAADLEICRRIGPMLRERGLMFVGIDVIAGRLTEINVTSPTGLRPLLRYTGVDAAALLWDAIEKRRSAPPPA
jgi:glutathione synthase